MADITASMVKELRETTGAGMMDCKKALEETGGDMAAAIDLLRVKGLAKAAKKADRVASEGVVAVATSRSGAGASAAAIELNSETDFVARNETFQGAARQIAEASLGVSGGVDALRSAKVGGQSADELIAGLIATIGENMTLRRFARLSVSQGAVGAYVHNKVPGATDLGRMGVIVEGRIRKWMEDVVLLKQPYVKNPDQTIEQLVAETGKQVGSPIKVAGFVRLALGEGVEKKEDDFAAEVAKMTKG